MRMVMMMAMAMVVMMVIGMIDEINASMLMLT